MRCRRDALMETVVLPRYMKVTSDGTQLGPTWWAEAVGATYESVRMRVRRLQSAESDEADGSSTATYDSIQKRIERLRRALETADPGTSSTAAPVEVRRAKSDLRRPGVMDCVLADPEVRKAVTDAIGEDSDGCV